MNRFLLRRPLHRPLAIALIACLCASAWAQPTETDIQRAIAQLDEGDWIQRWGAMQVLGEAKANDAVAPLRRLHADERQNPWLRGRALVALAQIQPTVILPVAVRLAEDARDKQLQAAAVEALGIAGLPRGKDALLKVLQSDSPAVRDAAVEAYARVAGPEALPFIDAALRSKEPGAVRHAVRGLSHVDRPDARQRLWDLIASEDEQTATEAIAAAARLQSPEAIPALLRGTANPQRERIASTARRALIAYPADVLAAPLATALRDGDDATRRAALDILKTRPTPQAVQAVADLAATDALDVPTLVNALDLMGQVEPARFRETVISRLGHESPEVRRAAARQLDRVEGDVFTLLRPLLSDADAGVRAEAIQTLRRTSAATPEGGIIAYLSPALRQVAPAEASGLLALVAGRLEQAEHDAAVQELARFLAATPSRNDAMVSLSRVSDDDALKRKVVAAMGFVSAWRTVGPFGNAGDAAERIESRLPPEESPNQASYQEGNRTLAWVVIDRPGIDGVFDPGSYPEIMGEGPRGGTLVATSVVEATEAMKARLTVSANGAAVSIWLNGNSVVTRRERGEIVEDVQLTAGINRLVVKLGGQPEQWIFSARLSDAEGNAVSGVSYRIE